MESFSAPSEVMPTSRSFPPDALHRGGYFVLLFQEFLFPPWVFQCFFTLLYFSVRMPETSDPSRQQCVIRGDYMMPADG